jgi:hypothetical protein
MADYSASESKKERKSLTCLYTILNYYKNIFPLPLSSSTLCIYDRDIVQWAPLYMITDNDINWLI